LITRAILVVEDEPGIAEIIEFMLNDEPRTQATAVPDGATALVFLAEVRVDLIFSTSTYQALTASPSTLSSVPGPRPRPPLSSS
jgi:two-component SAPR family response regulator